MAGWATCRNCHEKIWWGSAPFDSTRNWPFDDQDEHLQHFDTCAAVERVTDRAGKAHRLTPCRACGQRVWWDTTPRGKRRPMNVAGDLTSDVCHFDTCPGEPVGAVSEPVSSEPVDRSDIDLWLGQLGLTWPTDLGHVTAAFRKLAMRHHPDMGGQTSDFIRLKLAFERCKELLACSGEFVA
jgi:hypothetical protein